MNDDILTKVRHLQVEDRIDLENDPHVTAWQCPPENDCLECDGWRTLAEHEYAVVEAVDVVSDDGTELRVDTSQGCFFMPFDHEVPVARQTIEQITTPGG